MRSEQNSWLTCGSLLESLQCSLGLFRLRRASRPGAEALAIALHGC